MKDVTLVTQMGNADDDDDDDDEHNEWAEDDRITCDASELSAVMAEENEV